MASQKKQRKNRNARLCKAGLKSKNLRCKRLLYYTSSLRQVMKFKRGKCE